MLPFSNNCIQIGSFVRLEFVYSQTDRQTHIQTNYNENITSLWFFGGMNRIEMPSSWPWLLTQGYQFQLDPQLFCKMRMFISKFAHWQTDRQTDKYTERQTEKKTDRQTDRQVEVNFNISIILLKQDQWLWWPTLHIVINGIS